MRQVFYFAESNSGLIPVFPDIELMTEAPQNGVGQD